MRIRDRYILSVITDMIIFTIIASSFMKIPYIGNNGIISFGFSVCLFITIYSFDYLLKGYSLGKFIFRIRLASYHDDWKMKYLHVLQRRIIETFYIYFYIFGKRIKIDEITHTKIVSSAKSNNSDK
jgi:hypothetical protein